MFHGKKKVKHHELSEVQNVYVGCGCMDYSYHYSFSVYYKDEKWLLDADCFIRDHMDPIEISGCEISSEDKDKLFNILEQNDLISYVEKYKKPGQFFQALDETTYGISIFFTDGSAFHAEPLGEARSRLEDYFYNLADNIGKERVINHEFSWKVES